MQLLNCTVAFTLRIYSPCFFTAAPEKDLTFPAFCDTIRERQFSPTQQECNIYMESGINCASGFYTQRIISASPMNHAAVITRLS